MHANDIFGTAIACLKISNIICIYLNKKIQWYDERLFLSFGYAVLNISLENVFHCHQSSYSWHNCILQFANPFKQIAKRKFLSLSTLDHDMQISIFKPSIAVLICSSKIFVSNKKNAQLIYWNYWRKIHSVNYNRLCVFYIFCG